MCSTRCRADVDACWCVTSSSASWHSPQTPWTKPGAIWRIAPGGSRQRRGILLLSWTPAVRVLISAAGGALALYGLRQRQALGLVTGLIGAGMLARAVTSLELQRLLGMKAGRRAVDIVKTLHIQAPLEEVYPRASAFRN